MFKSITYGSVTLEQMFNIISKRLDDVNDYEIAVGTDSHSRRKSVIVTVVSVRIIGKGVFYFYLTKKQKRFNSLTHKIETETYASIEVGTLVKEKMLEYGLDTEKLYIDLDMGNKGPTKDLLKHIIGWVMGVGFKYRIKPEAYSACRIADRRSK